MSNVKTQHEKDLVSNCNSVFKDGCEEHIKHTWKGLFPWPTASTEGLQKESDDSSLWLEESIQTLADCGKRGEFLHQMLTHSLTLSSTQLT